MNKSGTDYSQWRLWRTAMLCLAFPVVLTGCGSGDLASVNGIVKYNGEPVTGGTVLFHPISDPDNPQPGRSAQAVVQPDGSYTLGTNQSSDGAKIGQHRVVFLPPDQKLTDEQRTDPKYIAPPPLYFGLVSKTTEVEVKPGKNVIDLELVKKPEEE